LECRFIQEQNADVTAPALAAQLQLIAQEAVTNAVRHARPQAIEIRLRQRGGKISLTIHDDGCGFEAAPGTRRSAGTMGLAVMRYRAEIIGAELRITSTPGKGSDVMVYADMAHLTAAPPPA